MAKGKHWTPQEETELKNLMDSNTDIETIATKLGKTRGAITIKSQRLGLLLQSEGYRPSIPMPRQLPSVEETLKMLAGALKTAAKPGLDKAEVSRLQTVATIAKIYKEILSDYINYRGIEVKLKEMEEQNAQILKEGNSNNAPQRDPTPVA
jgi:hypothetical protein